MNDKILFVIFGEEKLINNFKKNEKHYPSSSNCIELNNYQDLEKQLGYILNEDDMSHKEYIVLHIFQYDVDILDYITDQIEDIDNLNVKFLVLSEEMNEDTKKYDEIKDLVKSINNFKEKIEDGEDRSHEFDGEKELNKLLGSEDPVINLDSIDFLIDVTKKFDKNKKGMDEKLRNSILSSLLMISTKLEIDNEKLLDDE